MADVGVALVLLIAFNLVAAQGSKELVRERLSEEKRILFLAGVHPITYWITALIWDFLVSETITTREENRIESEFLLLLLLLPGVRMLHRFGRVRLRDLWPVRVRRQGQFVRHLFIAVPVRVSFFAKSFSFVSFLIDDEKKKKMLKVGGDTVLPFSREGVRRLEHVEHGPVLR